MRVPTLRRKTMPAFMLASASAFAQLPASASTAIMHSEQPALRDERLSEQRVRDEQLHEQQLHEQRLHDERVHEQRLRDERIHEQRLRDARSNR